MSDSYQETSDLAIAAYVHMRGVEVVSARELRGAGIGGGFQYQFVFRCTTAQWDELTQQFANSDCARYDGSVRTLKKLCKGRPARAGDVRRLG